MPKSYAIVVMIHLRVPGDRRHIRACSIGLSRRHAVFVESTYQKGFETIGDQKYGPSYLMLSAGWRGSRFGD
jgi:hypothetical protein